MAPAADTAPRRPRWRTVLIVVLLAVVAAWLGRGGVRDLLEIERGPDVAAENDLLGRLNGLRSGEGLPALRVHPQLVDKARGWSARMAREQRLYHSPLSDGLPPDWERVGENVAQGSASARIHDAWVGSPDHYKNLSDPGFTHVGVGVVADDAGTLYATQVFMQQGQPGSAAPRRPSLHLVHVLELLRASEPSR